MKNEPVKCLECGEIVKGRADKRFCTDQCRSQFNNKLNSDRVNLIRNVNFVLKKNRRIMEGILQNGAEVLKHKNIKRSVLLNSGFDFRYMTHRHITRKGDIYTYCYEFGYRELEENWFMIVRDDKAVPEKQESEKEMRMA
jgi:hypothetical protein